MRPRVFPAEDGWEGPREGSQSCRFNEAAGIPRGRLDVVVELVRERQASMRPRVFPAEDGNPALRFLDPPPASMRPRVFPAEDLRERMPKRTDLLLQ